MTREDYQASEDDNELVTGVAGDEGGLGYFGFSYYEQNLDKLNLVGVDEDAASCVKPSPRRSRTAPTSRSRVRCSCTRARRRSHGPRSRPSWTSSWRTRQTIAEAAQIVPMTDAQAHEAKDELAEGRGGRVAGAHGRRRDAAAAAGAHGVPDQPGPDPHARARAGESAIKARCSSPPRSLSVLTTIAIVFSLLRGDDRLLRRRRRRRLPVRRRSGRRCSRRPAVLRRPAARLGHALPDRHRACSSRSRSGSVPRSTSPSTRRRACARSSSRCSRRWPASRPSSSATSRSPSSRRRAPRRPRARRQPVQRACRPASSWASSSCRRSPRSPRTRCRPCPPSLREGAFGLGASKLQVSTARRLPGRALGHRRRDRPRRLARHRRDDDRPDRRRPDRRPRRRPARVATRRWPRSSPRRRAATSRPARSTTRRSSSSASRSSCMTLIMNASRSASSAATGRCTNDRRARSPPRARTQQSVAARGRAAKRPRLRPAASACCMYHRARPRVPRARRDPLRRHARRRSEALAGTS